MLSINGLTYRIGGRLLFDEASAQIGPRRRIGVVGRNGSGKSTLLRLIAGEAQPDGGEVALGKRTRVGQVAQFAPRGDAPVIDVVLAADTERAELLAEAATAEQGHRIAQIHARLEEIPERVVKRWAAHLRQHPRTSLEDAAALVLALRDGQLENLEAAMLDEGIRLGVRFYVDTEDPGRREILRAYGSLLPGQRQVLLAGGSVGYAAMPPIARRWLHKALDKRQRFARTAFPPGPHGCSTRRWRSRSRSRRPR